MTRLVYFVGKALGGMRAAPFVHLVTALTIGVALTLATVTGVVAAPAGALLEAWGLRAELTLYLAPGTDAAAGAAVAAEAAEAAEGDARFVPPEEALARLRVALGEGGSLLDDLPANPLPPSVEVRPGKARTAREVAALATKLSELAGVDEVDYGGEWIDRVAGLSRAARLLGLVLVPLIVLGAAVLAGSVIRLGVYARREEIEIMKLVGATDAFVRAPFLVEGFLAGALGGGLAAAALLWLAHRIGPELAAALPLPPELGPSALATGTNLALVALAGALLGLASSALSVGRHLRT